MAGILGDLSVNPFVHNPALDVPQDNFIQKGISDGIERGMGKVGDNLIHAGQVKTESFAHNLPEIATLALIMYLIYLGYMSFIKSGQKQEMNFSKIYPVFMVYIVFKLVWKVILKI